VTSLNPSPSYYAQFQGYTLGLCGALVTSVTVYLLGSHVFSPFALRDVSQAEREERLQRFKSNCLARVLLLLYLVYPGACQGPRRLHSCRT
jgi:fumarate reductase subunit D